MNAVMRLVLCVAVLAGGVMVGGKAGGGGGVSYPNYLFKAIIEGESYDYIAQYLQARSSTATYEVNSVYNGLTPLDYAQKRSDGKQLADLLINWGAQDPGLLPVGQGFGY